MIDPNKLCQLELHSTDNSASSKFFADVFGWPTLPVAMHEYSVLVVPKDCPYGISIVRVEAEALTAPLTGVVPYFALDQDITEFLSKVLEAGGRLIWGPRTAPAYGQIYMIEAPGGIRLGIYLPMRGQNT